MMDYTINKGSKKTDSFYLNDLGYKNIHYLDATKKEVKSQTKDKFNFVCRPLPNRVFSIKKNSWHIYHSIEEAKSMINHAINDIKNDERYNDYIKDELIKYAKSLKIVEHEI